STQRYSQIATPRETNPANAAMNIQNCIIPIPPFYTPERHEALQRYEPFIIHGPVSLDKNTASNARAASATSCVALRASALMRSG
ncbi:MAG: hypothetical protein ACPLRM_06020, partial [Anaerolineae bacterium]